MCTLKIPNDVIVLPAKDNHWIIFNVFTKSAVGVNNETLSIFKLLENGRIRQLSDKKKNTKWLLWNIEKFTNEDGLMADPSRFIRDVDNWSNPKELSLNLLIDEFKKRFLVIDDTKKYQELFGSKKSLLDMNHLGNFHEQLGQHLTLNKRHSPSEWWLNQKFEKDLTNTKNNLYRAVQTFFLKRYIPKKIHKGDCVIDLGCGVGFYSKIIGKTGANVLGLDPSNEYVTLAKKNCPSNVKFQVANVGFKGALDDIKSNSVDFIFMSDALLFYFVPIDKMKKPELKILLADIRRVLKPTGTFVNIEPHYLFWLLPWLGEVERPFTIITEYKDKQFGVTPNFSQYINSITEEGFLVKNMEEIYPDPTYEPIDKRAFNFANQFPLWQLFEFIK